MDRHHRIQVRQQLCDYIDTVLCFQYPTLFNVDEMREVIYAFVNMQLGRLQISMREGQPLSIDDLCRGLKQCMLQYYSDYRVHRSYYCSQNEEEDE